MSSADATSQPDLGTRFEALRARLPGARVLAMDAGTNMPTAVPRVAARYFPDSYPLTTRMITLVCADDRPAIISCWSRARRLGMAECEARSAGTLAPILVTIMHLPELGAELVFVADAELVVDRMPPESQESAEAVAALSFTVSSPFVLATDVGGRIEWVAPATCRRLGLLESDLVGSHVASLMSEDDMPAAAAAYLYSMAHPHVRVLLQARVTISGRDDVAASLALINLGTARDPRLHIEALPPEDFVPEPGVLPMEAVASRSIPATLS